jgi:RNA polymerase sporulation-specific sigma factor
MRPEAELSCIIPAAPGNTHSTGGDCLQGKVEICGVNTAKLPVLKSRETLELIKKAQDGDSSARDELISGNLRLVLSVIQKFAGRGESMDDLFQVGCVGLIKAIDAFDLGQGVQFSTYGVPMIAGELRRFLRDHSAVRVSRSMRDTAYRVMQAREKLTAATGREPNVEEIAKELGIKREEVVFAMDAVCDPVSLYEPVYSDTGESVCVMDQIGDTRNTDDSWLERLALGEAVGRLTQRQKRILALRFCDGRTQMEVAREIGISQAQVSRLEKDAVGQIKKELYTS